MFHFPTFPPHALCVQARVTPHDWCGVPPFGNPRINARLTAPRGLSQPPTSFIGSWCQGIHRAPLTTWPHKNPTHRTPGRTSMSGPTQTLRYRVRRCSRPLCSSQRTTSHRPRVPAEPRAGHGRYGKQNGPDMSSRLPAPSGPNSVPTAIPGEPDSGPRRPRRNGSTGSPHPRAGRTGQRSTLEHHPTRCAGTRSWAPITVWARPWTTRTRRAASAP
jgi:hypothetical protein